MSSFKENIETIVSHYEQASRQALGEASDVKAVRYDRPKSVRQNAHVVLWSGEGTAYDEIQRLERSVANLALLVRARDVERYLISTFGEGSDALRKARRKAALEEVGRSPVEVALLYGYSSSNKIRELRVRNGRNADDGTTVAKPLTRRSA